MYRRWYLIVAGNLNSLFNFFRYVVMADTLPAPPISNEEALNLCKEPEEETKVFFNCNKIWCLDYILF